MNDIEKLCQKFFEENNLKVKACEYLAGFQISENKYLILTKHTQLFIYTCFIFKKIEDKLVFCWNPPFEGYLSDKTFYIEND